MNNLSELQIKSAWLKMMINSSYGNSFLLNKYYDKYLDIKRKIRLIESRKIKIKLIFKND